MNTLTICYDFKFSLSVRKKNGKTYHNHTVTGMGISYSTALWEVYQKLRRRKTVILEVASVGVLRIVFALRDGESFKAVLTDHPPIIPENLNDELKYLTHTNRK